MSYVWTRTERAVLASFVGDYPWSLAIAHYRLWAQQNGFPERTDLALRLNCEARQISRRAQGSYLSTGLIVRALGIGWPVVQRWIQKGWLKPHREGTRYYVPRKQLRRLTKLAPEHFAGRDVVDLEYLLGDEELAKQLHAMPRMYIRGTQKPVRCIERCRVYASVREAARAVYVTPQAIQKAIYRGTPSAGVHWEWA